MKLTFNYHGLQSLCQSNVHQRAQIKTNLYVKPVGELLKTPKVYIVIWQCTRVKLISYVYYVAKRFILDANSNCTSESILGNILPEPLNVSYVVLFSDADRI